MLQIRKEQIQSLRQNINLSFRQEVLDILKENDYETIEDLNTNDIGIKDKRGNISWLRYNQDAQPNIFELPSGTAYNLNYYSDGALQAIQMPNGNAIELFTQDGKLLNLKHKGGSSISLKYNKDNKISDILISKKKKYQFKYDEQYGYFNALVDGNKETKYFNHDNSGNLRQKIDAENRTTYFHYEVGEDELKEIHYPDGRKETYRYNDDENFLEITQRNNSLVKNFYDDEDNLRQVEWQDGSYILIEKDEKDDIASIQNENVLINLKKDDKDRIIEEESDFASIKYEYDVEEQLSKLTYSDNYELTYEYDVDGELSAIKDSEGNQHLLSHDAKASTYQIIFQGGNAVYTIREHFNGQIVETNINTNSGHSYGQIYEYDDQERLSKIDDSRSKFPTRYISYDDADHLLAVKDDKEKIIERFEYDKSGQMTFANNNNIVIGPMEEVKFYGEKQLSYDANGNLVNFNGIKAVYKNNGVLAEIEANGQKWNYEYDPFGRRVKKTNGRETVTYIWAGVQLLEEIHTSAEGNQTKQKYLYRPFEQIPFAIKDEKGLYLLQQDHRGAIIRAVDTFGELVWEAEYDAFGKAYLRTEKINQPWRLQGQYFDKESELHYNVGRYYCPKLKTYLSRDPQWHEVEASNYNYANNDPYNKADSLGAFWHIVGGAVVGAVVGGVISAATGGSWREIAAAAAGGAVAGAIVAANPASLLLGIAGSGAGSVVDSLLNGKNESIACSLATGLLGGLAGGLLGKAVGALLKRGVGLFKRLSSKLLNRPPKVPKRIIVRRDDFLYSKQGKKPGSLKSHIDDKGNLQPANSVGKTSATAHVKGSSASDSPYTSFSKAEGAGKNYGSKKIELDADRLKKDIKSGKVKDVEIVEHEELLLLHDEKIKEKQLKFDKNPSPNNKEKLDAAITDKSHSVRDNEILIKGTVPKDYIKIIE